jgi:hypothetical protein
VTEPDEDRPSTVAAVKRPHHWWQRGVAGTLGGALVGVEQQLWRDQPPPQELVHHARPDDPMPLNDGGRLVVIVPGQESREDPMDDDR